MQRIERISNAWLGIGKNSNANTIRYAIRFSIQACGVRGKESRGKVRGVATVVTVTVAMLVVWCGGGDGGGGGSNRGDDDDDGRHGGSGSGK